MKNCLRQAKISATGMYVPDHRLSNVDLEKTVDTSDQWIRSRTGIVERRIVANGQACSHLAVEALRRALELRGLAATDLDLIIVATVTPDMFFPSTACLIQERIGATKAWGFDLSAACSGFLYALSTGAQFIQTGTHRRVAVIGADVMTSILDFKDRATCVLFGDGAGAVLLEPAEAGEEGIIDCLLRSDGAGGRYLNMPGGGSLHPASAETVAQNMHCVHQDGAQVFKFAIRGMADISSELLKKWNYSVDDLALYVPHQANIRIIDAAAERLGLDRSKVAINIDRYANTTAATIPICLAEAQADQRVKKGDLVMLASFGAGFTWGSILLRWTM